MLGSHFEQLYNSMKDKQSKQYFYESLDIFFFNVLWKIVRNTIFFEKKLCCGVFCSTNFLFKCVVHHLNI